MSIQGFKAELRAAGAGYSDILLPEDVYQCVIERVELREGTKYKSAEKEMQLLFYLRPLEVKEEEKDKLLFYQTNTVFHSGIIPDSDKKMKPTRLYSVIRAVYTYYQPKVDVDAIKPEDINDDTINYLEGKQVRASVEVTPASKNKVSKLLPIKSEIGAEKKEETPDEELRKIVGE